MGSLNPGRRRRLARARLRLSGTRERLSGTRERLSGTRERLSGTRLRLPGGSPRSPGRRLRAPGPGGAPARRRGPRLRPVPSPNRRLPARLWWTGGALALVGLVSWVVAWSPFLDVDRIEVTGLTRISRSEALAVARVREGPALLALDVPAAVGGLEAVPWIRRAAVSRHPPGLVRISVEERQPLVALARPGGGFALLDDSGRVLTEAPERPAALPLVAGLGDPPSPGGWLDGPHHPLEAVLALPADLRPRVDVARADDGLLGLVLRDGTEVRLGRPSELAAKGAALAAVLTSLGERRVAYVDVRVPSAPAVGPLGPAPTRAPPAGGASTSAPATRATAAAPRD